MKNNFTANKSFLLKIALLHVCLFLSVWIGKSHETASSVADLISSKAEVVVDAPMLVQMLNKWYFIGF